MSLSQYLVLAQYQNHNTELALRQPCVKVKLLTVVNKLKNVYDAASRHEVSMIHFHFPINRTASH